MEWMSPKKCKSSEPIQKNTIIQIGNWIQQDKINCVNRSA